VVEPQEAEALPEGDALPIGEIDADEAPADEPAEEDEAAPEADSDDDE
jgi:hypothetical protein